MIRLDTRTHIVTETFILRLILWNEKLAAGIVSHTECKVVKRFTALIRKCSDTTFFQNKKIQKPHDLRILKQVSSE